MIQNFLNGTHRKKSNKEPEEQEMYDLWGTFHCWITALFINDPENAPFKPEEGKKVFGDVAIRNHLRTFIQEAGEKIWKEKPSQPQNSSDTASLSDNEISSQEKQKRNRSDTESSSESEEEDSPWKKQKTENTNFSNAKAIRKEGIFKTTPPQKIPTQTNTTSQKKPQKF